jgi:hypothetical protein
MDKLAHAPNPPIEQAHIPKIQKRSRARNKLGYALSLDMRRIGEKNYHFRRGGYHPIKQFMKFGAKASHVRVASGHRRAGSSPSEAQIRLIKDDFYSHRIKPAVP